MTKRLFVLLGVLLLLGVSIGSVNGAAKLGPRLPPQDVPKPAVDSWVSDPYEQLTTATIGRINLISDKLEKDLSDELAIVVIKRMAPGWDIEAYAKKLIDLWGIGKADKNNGVVILVATEDREMRIQTGKGARERLTDSRAEKIVQSFMIPKLKDRNLNDAVRMGVVVADDILRGQTNYVNETKDFLFFMAVVVGIVAVVGLCIRHDLKRNARRKEFEARLRRLQEMSNNREQQANQGPAEPASCCICLDQLPDANEAQDTNNPPVVTACNHPFHFKCIAEWLARSDTCPVCRRSHPLESNADASSSAQPPPQPARPESSWRDWFTRRRPSTPGYHYRPYHFRPYHYNRWGGWCSNDWDRLVVLQQQRYPDVQRDFNITGEGRNFTFTRVTPPPSSSGKSGRSFGGGSSSGGGGASGRW